MDSTTVALPDGLAAVRAGCGGRVAQGGRAALKPTVRLDLRAGQPDGPLLSDGRAQDKTGPLRHAPPPGCGNDPERRTVYERRANSQQKADSQGQRGGWRRRR